MTGNEISTTGLLGVYLTLLLYACFCTVHQRTYSINIYVLFILKIMLRTHGPAELLGSTPG